MSKKSYINGFCKAAEARGVDPRSLVEFVMAKKAADDNKGGGFMDSVSNGIGSFANWWRNSEGDSEREVYKALIGALAGGGLGVGVGSALAGRGGVRSGAILGSLVGAGGAVNWDVLKNALGSLADKAKQRAAAAAQNNNSNTQQT